MPPKPRTCQQCTNPLPEDSSKLRKYCSKRCREAFGRERISKHKASIEKSAKRSPVTPAMKQFRELMEDGDPFVRETLQEALRDVVTMAVADNLIGAGEILTGMLPKALAGIAVDLESKDWMIRSRAQAAVLKYAMEFRDKDAKDLDLGTIQVVHQVAIPGTPLGSATVDHVEAKVIEGEVIESYELEWPVCYRCHERKHPGTVRDTPAGTVCTSCMLADNYARGMGGPDSMLDLDPEFGRSGS